MRTQRGYRLGLGFAALVAVACGSDEQKGPRAECAAGPEVPGPSGADQPIRGSVTLLDKKDLTLDDTGAPMNLVQSVLTGSFADFSTVTSTPSPLMLLGDTCVGIVGRPVTMGQPRRLDLATLTIEGTAMGDVVVTRTSTGVYRKIGTEHLMPGAGSIRIVGEAAMDGYPAFDEPLGAVAAMEVDAPKTDGTALLLPDDLEISWTAGDGDYVLVSVVPKMEMGMTGTGGQVQCIARDDGCFTLPGAASTFLLASQADTYTLSVSRRRYRVLTPASETGLELEAISELRATLLNGVLAP